MIAQRLCVATIPESAPGRRAGRLTATHYQSGDMQHEQGISKAGNRWVRADDQHGVGVAPLSTGERARAVVRRVSGRGAVACARLELSRSRGSY